MYLLIRLRKDSFVFGAFHWLTKKNNQRCRYQNASNSSRYARAGSPSGSYRTCTLWLYYQKHAHDIQCSVESFENRTRQKYVRWPVCGLFSSCFSGVSPSTLWICKIQMHINVFEVPSFKNGKLYQARNGSLFSVTMQPKMITRHNIWVSKTAFVLCKALRMLKECTLYILSHDRVFAVQKTGANDCM